MNLIDSKQCPYCKTMNSAIAIKCSYCQTPFKSAVANTEAIEPVPADTPPNNYPPVQHGSMYTHQVPPTYMAPTYMAAPIRPSNGIGTAGFIISICAFVLSWIPVLGFILWLLGLIFSGVGMFKRPRGLATAGLVISLIWVILIVVLIGVIGLAIFAR